VDPGGSQAGLDRPQVGLEPGGDLRGREPVDPKQPRRRALVRVGHPPDRGSELPAQDVLARAPRASAIKSGDTLLAVAGRAFGLDSGKARLDAARVINDAAYNDRFRGPANKFFPTGQVSFLPRFIEDPLEQAAEDGPAPAGHDFAVLWIPGEGGQEPDLEDPEPAPTLRPEVIPVIIIPGILGSAVGPVSRRDRRKNGPG